MEGVGGIRNWRLMHMTMDIDVIGMVPPGAETAAHVTDAGHGHGHGHGQMEEAQRREDGSAQIEIETEIGIGGIGTEIEIEIEILRSAVAGGSES
mmetsp:Transcript_33520/g.53924  ORF Transcript_33520/g.53924 Transcript_33520/m.53924 type:complete len:95 (+) Transcript_33520:987-1271(+)